MRAVCYIKSPEALMPTGPVAAASTGKQTLAYATKNIVYPKYSFNKHINTMLCMQEIARY